MAKSPVSELFGTLRSYATKLSDGERTPAEIAAALNDWAHESKESIRARVHEEVEAAVLKMGFIKREEFDALATQVAQLTQQLNEKTSQTDKSPAKKRTLKKVLTKKAVK
ncbi:hypothetical protein MCEMRE203_00601 [Candidatus Nanopelagicaceae bacterium]